jgi:hypothetical protein
MSCSENPGVSENPRRHLAEVRSAIEARLAPQGKTSVLASIGDGGEVVVVRLNPSAASIAGELKREFGDSVSITVGFKPFPFGDAHLAPLSLEPSEAGKPGLPLRITCEITDTRIRPGDSTTGRLLILNRGSARVEFFAAASVGWLCVPGTLDVVGGYSGAMAAVERAIELDASGITSLNFIVGTASCEVNDRYVVKAGTYEVVVPLSVWDAGSTRNPIRLLVRDCFVTVTDVEPTGEA